MGFRHFPNIFNEINKLRKSNTYVDCKLVFADGSLMVHFAKLLAAQIWWTGRLKEIHELHTETRLGTQAHQNRLLKSSCLINFKNEGFRMMEIGVPHDMVEEFWNSDNLI